MNHVEAIQKRRIDLGPLCIDTANRLVRIRERAVEMTTAEFDLLWLLACHAGEVLSRDRLYEEMRGFEYDGLDRSIDLRISRLRRKLGDEGKQPRIIKSIRGVGYLLVENP
jgi:two-component system, OmpR family, response regulator RstA